MNHTEISNALNEKLHQMVSNRGGSKLSFLDLGCGDGYYLSKLPLDDLLNLYIGIDLKQESLELLELNFQQFELKPMLLNKNIHGYLDYLSRFNYGIKTQSHNLTFDVIFSSLAFHHLQQEDKRILKQIFTYHLNTDGIIMLADVFPQEPSNYVPIWEDTINNTWDALNTSQKEEIIKHITEYDYPEPTSFYDDLLGQQHTKLFQNDEIQLICYTKK